MINIQVRPAEEKDLESIFRIEKRSYPPELQAPHKVLIDRFEIFGIRVAELNDEVVGFYTCVPIYLDWSNERKVIEVIKQNRNPHYTKWFEQYRNGGHFNTLYVTSTAVSSNHQGKGIGKLLVEHSLDLARENGLDYRASVLRVKGFREFFNKNVSIEDYLKGVKRGEITNPVLGLYLSLGFNLGPVIPDYEPDRSSMNYGVFAFKRVGGKYVR